jgi:DNA-directed RNA polymerase subunit E'/Rpb7
MKTIKVVVSIVVLLAIVAVGIIFYGLSNLNGFIEKVIEDTGTNITKTSVNVGSVDVKPLEGSGAIYALSIANPKGYSSNKLFVANSVALKIDVKSVTNPVKVIKLVSVGEMSLRVEQKNIKDTNVQALLDNMQQVGGEKTNTKGDTASDVRIMIEKISFAATAIDLQTEKFGGKTIDLPAFSLNNIGDKKTGVTPEQAGQKITKQLMEKVKIAVKKELGKLLSEEAKDKLKEKLQDKLKDSIDTDKLKSLFK